MKVIQSNGRRRDSHTSRVTSFRCMNRETIVACVLLIVVGLTLANDSSAATVEAYSGEPFGVGRVTVSLDPSLGDDLVESKAFFIDDAEGRIHYPAFTTRPILNRLLSVLSGGKGNTARSMTAFFLFTGTSPLRIEIQGSSNVVVTARPANRPRSHRRFLERWWNLYERSAVRQIRSSDYPPYVETYLVYMLAGRMGLSLPAELRRFESAFSEPRTSLALLTGSETLYETITRQILTGRYPSRSDAILQTPSSIDWSPIQNDESADDVRIEPIAFHVPEECLYVRFGQFRNYIWLNRLLDRFGGDVRRMVSLRGHSVSLNERVQRQLALKETVLAELLGDQVISDIAIIGQDSFVNEGAAIGVLFEARNSLLGVELSKQRAAARKKADADGATIETKQIAGHDVSLLATPGNRIRSYYAVDGHYHLVTTTRKMAERFYEAGAGTGSLGGSSEFQQARRSMRIDREDTVFAYLSSRFFQELLSPLYQIELRRRLLSLAEIDIYKIARLSARSEGITNLSPESLISLGFLPPGFGQRADGSRLAVNGDTIFDSLRGHRGSFVPIPDVSITSVTADEAEYYNRLIAFHDRQWRQMDPLMVGIKRNEEKETGKDIISIDAWMLPFNPSQYGTITSVLGPPTFEQIAHVKGDIIMVQAMVQGGLLRPSIRPHHLFLGIQDTRPTRIQRDGGLLQVVQLLSTTPGYLGAWPKLGLLDFLPLLPSRQADIEGYSQLPLGLWRRQINGFSVLSFVHPVLQWVTPQLRVEPSDTNAQVRVYVGNLHQAKVSTWLNELYYNRARQVSIGNARFLHNLVQQFGIAPNEALSVAEYLLNVKLICDLGGEYQLLEKNGMEYWASTAWSANRLLASDELPEDYQAPVLTWFRGLDADLTMLDDRLFAHAQLTMEREEAAPIFGSSLLDLFGGNNKKKKGEEKPAPTKPRYVEELPPPRDP